MTTYTYTTLDYFGPYRTFLSDINDAGQIIGQYTTYGVDLLYSNGSFTTLDYLNNPFGSNTYAYATALNNVGEIVGIWNYNGADAHPSFLYNNGTFTDISFPGAYSNDTSALSVNDLGQIVGIYAYAPYVTHSFLYSGGAYYDIEVNTSLNGITTAGDGVSTSVAAINNAGELVGSVGTHGFTYNINTGAFGLVDYSGATSTSVVWVNNNGDLLGSYSDATGIHYFVEINGQFSTIDGLPGAPSSINDAEQIVGTYFDGSIPYTGAYRGFLAAPVTQPITYSFTTLDVPGSTFTHALGVNNAGQIVGEEGNGGHVYGFLFSGGSYTIVDPPGDVNGVTGGGINDLGQIVGAYANGITNVGFLYSGGVYTSLFYPTAVFSTFAADINDVGQVVGVYGDSNALAHGFLYSGGVYTSFDDPLATGGTWGYGINNAGQIVGNYIDAIGSHGFLYSGGTYLTIDDPLAAPGETFAKGINEEGQIVGYYLDAQGLAHGFIDTNGIFTTIDDKLGVKGTYIQGVNDSGEIVGYYNDANGVGHGFLAVASTNQPPVASNISADANEDTNTLPAILKASFSDPDQNDTFTFQTDATGTMGTVINNGDGTVTYDPNGKFEYLGVGETATDTFTYTVTDRHGASSTATATITIHGENDAPVALPDIVSFQKGTTVSADKAHGVLANDTDPDTHDILTVTAVNGSSTLVGRAIKGTYGTLTLLADGSFNYVAKNNAVVGAQDVFQYSVSDGHGGTSSSTLTLQVPYPSLIVSSATLAGTINERPLVTGSSANDTIANQVIAYNVPDPNNRPTASLDLTHQTITWQDSTHDYTSELSLLQKEALKAAFSIAQTDNASTGKVLWTYKIADVTLDFLGANETLTVTTPILVDDHHGHVATENVTVTINGGDDKPTASRDTVAALQSGTVRVDAVHGVLANDTDPDSHDQGHLIVSAVQGDASAVGHPISGKYGDLTLEADGSYNYVETARVPDGAGPDVFKYTVSDGRGGTIVSTLSINVPPGERVTFQGSDLVFYNTYDATVTPAYHKAIIAAENFFQSHFSNAVTINLSFSTKAPEPGALDFAATNLPTMFGIANTAYADLRAHLQTHMTTADDITAVAGLPDSFPTNGMDFFITYAEEKALGLRDPNDNQIDGTVYLNSNLMRANSYFFNGAPTNGDANKIDAVGALIHEISEEMGRLGGLGPDVEGYWSSMDLFRFNSSGQRDYSGSPAYFSLNGAVNNLSFVFNDATFRGPDPADWHSNKSDGALHYVNSIDAFGGSAFGLKQVVSLTDLQVMDILGWTPTTPAVIALNDHLLV